MFVLLQRPGSFVVFSRRNREQCTYFFIVPGVEIPMGLPVLRRMLSPFKFFVCISQYSFSFSFPSFSTAAEEEMLLALMASRHHISSCLHRKLASPIIPSRLDLESYLINALFQFEAHLS